MVHKMYAHTWFLLFAGVWVVVACTPTPEAVVTVVADRPTGAATPLLNVPNNTPLPSNSPTTTPLLISQSPTALPTPISTQDVAATQTAIHATIEAEAATLFAPTPTFTPSPTFTPVPGPIWRIFFSGIPCLEGTSICDYTLAMHHDRVGYLINSDGSQLTPITDLGFPADFSYPVFSPDGTQLAYTAQTEPDGSVHLFLANVDNSNITNLGVGNFLDYQFTPEVGCLVTAQFVSWVTGKMNVVLEKRCTGQTQPQELENLTLPVFHEIHFSPQGDSLLAYGRNSLDEVHLLVHEIGGETQVIFSQDNEYFTRAAYWLPNGEKINFISSGYLSPNNTITTTFNLVERDGSNLEVRLNIVNTDVVGSGTWSPDGEEFAFTYETNSPPNESGLYILDLDTGEWRQILSHFFIGSPAPIYKWVTDTDGASN